MGNQLVFGSVSVRLNDTEKAGAYSCQMASCYLFKI